MIQKSEQFNKRGHTYLQWAFAILANIFTFSYGLESGWTSPITKTLQSESSPTGEPLTNIQISWIASFMSMAAVVGVPIFSMIAERYGSKTGIILLAPLQVIAWIIRIIHSTSTTLMIARIITGLAAGGLFNVVPMYVKEISQDNIRGMLGSLLLLAINLGVFIMFIIGAYMDYYVVMYISTSIPLVAVLIMIKAPNSPAFLVKQQKLEEARDTIALLRGLSRDDEIVQAELKFLQREDEKSRSEPNVSIKTILCDKSSRWGFVLVIVLFICHDLNGAYPIVTYASAILVATGVEINISPELQTLSIPFFMIVSSFILTTIVERCGRKMLLSASFLITAVSLSVLAAAILLQKAGWSVPSWLPILAMVLIVSMYAGGVSPLSYIIMTELFSFQVRAKVMGYVVTFGWFLSFVALAIYAPITNAFGQHTTFLVYGAFNVFGAIFVFICLIETRGKNDEEIREELGGSKTKEGIEK